MNKIIAIGSILSALVVWCAPLAQAEEGAGSASASQQVSTAQPAKKPMRRLLMSGKKPAKKAAPPARPALSETEDRIKKEKKDKDRPYGWDQGKKKGWDGGDEPRGWDKKDR